MAQYRSKRGREQECSSVHYRTWMTAHWLPWFCLSLPCSVNSLLIPALSPCFSTLPQFFPYPISFLFPSFIPCFHIYIPTSFVAKQILPYHLLCFCIFSFTSIFSFPLLYIPYCHLLSLVTFSNVVLVLYFLLLPTKESAFPCVHFYQSYAKVRHLTFRPDGGATAMT